MRPSRSWRALLLAPQVTAWLLDLLQRPQPGGAGGAAAVQAARRLVVLLCGVSGDIFMPPQPSGAAHPPPPSRPPLPGNRGEILSAGYRPRTESTVPSACMLPPKR